MRFLLALMIGVWSAGTSRAADASWSVEGLSSKGWEIAGFTGTYDIRGFLILFKHRDRVFLVQCSTLLRRDPILLRCDPILARHAELLRAALSQGAMPESLLRRIVRWGTEDIRPRPKV